MADFDAETELQRYPLTGRFLENRLRHDLSEHEKSVLEASIHEVVTFDQSQRILHQGHVYNHSTMLIEGFILRTIEGPDRRYGVSFHVPGDFVDLHCFALKRLDHNLDTLGPVKLGYASHETLQQIMQDEPHLARLLWFSTLLDAALHREWVMKLEQLTTPRRIAHIFAEIWHRMKMVGLGDERGFDTPLTQADLGELTGATTIHINRALKNLRERGLASFTRGRVDIIDRAGMEEYGLFSSDYLYGEGALSLREGLG